MKKTLKTLSVLLIILCIFNLYGCASENEYIINERSNNKSDLSDSGADSDGKISLDPFEGLVVDFDGVSPFCTVSFNNSRCAEEVQLNVEYSTSPDTVTTDGTFSIGEDVTIYALQKNQYDDTQEYSLTETSKTYKVSDVPQYITEITSDMDLTQFKKQANDYLESITAFKVGDYLYDWDCITYKSNDTPNKNNTYFSVLKLNKYSKFSNELDCFNSINITYSIKMTAKSEETFNRYFTIIAKNIVQYPDGTIGWGKEDPADLSFEHNIDWTNMDSLINANITSNKADYNVTEISNDFK